MDQRFIERIIQQTVNEAVQERSSIHPVIPVKRAVALAMARCHAPEAERARISQLVCELSIRQQFVLEFEDL